MLVEKQHQSKASECRGETMEEENMSPLPPVLQRIVEEGRGAEGCEDAEPTWHAEY